ncbi:CapA family protein [Paenibacillus tepidiphilus]|uniref:CapA family protein n=1 Tax=Paenibacillus tepidiphilus TaxID=2608683 RepID=UPI0012399635|nr:CapA family protein [Paenibacillus tepidiphilus]
MYPPRSSNRQRRQSSNKRRRRTVWAWTNVSLLLMISALLLYYFLGDSGKSVSAPPPETAEVSATATADPPPSPTVTPSPATEPPVSPSPSVEPEKTPAPEVTETPPPSAEGTAKPEESAGTAAGNASDDGQGVSGLPGGDPGATVTLNFAGDVIFAGKAGELLQKQGYAYSYSALDGMFTKDDLTVVNLENPITSGGVGAANKQFVFKGAPEALDALKAAGVDAVNLANNHTLDQGEPGLLDTFKHLQERGIPYVGAGKNSKEAFTAQYFERKGIRIALLGFTRVIPESSWAAGPDKTGVAAVYDSQQGLKAIAAAKQKADLVVVVVHWGKERVEQYDGTQQTLGRSFIDAGADLVIGGHPHVLQGIEPYKGKWIAYSTGNFIFTRSTVPATWETAVFQAECTAGGECGLKLAPMHAELARPVPMDEVSGALLLQRVEALSAGLVKIGNDGTVTQAR